MAKKDDGGRSFKDFLAAAPSLDDAASDDSVELSGLVSRTSDGRFAISTHEGQTYELDVDAVREFREIEGAASAASIRVGRDVLEKAVIHPIKPLRKDLIKDIIKDIIKDPIKEVIWDHKSPHKDPIKDPITDTPRNKDIHKDPLSDVVTTPANDQVGTGFADVAVDPGGIGPVVNPAFGGGGGGAPFVMATPHQAPQHLLSLQAGVQAAPAAATATLAQADLHPKRIETLKEPLTDTHKELVIDTLKEVQHDTLKEVQHDTQKELIFDTHKELIIDTQKEIWETLVEGGPNTTVETAAEGNPGFPGQGGFPGQPGFLGGI